MLLSNALKMVNSTIRNVSTYKSSVALNNIYPKSSLDITKPIDVPKPNAKSQFTGFIPIDKVEVSYSRSSGPGGQNVNKVNTKVDVRFHVETADWLSEEVKRKIAEKLKSRINKDGYLVVRSERTRSQLYNQADAFTTLREMIKTACYQPEEPSPETLHMIRKRKEEANRRRLIEKREHSLKKQLRRDDY